MTRKNLVIVRAGDTSLHPGWLAGNPNRSWDVIVNYYGTDPEIYRNDDVIRIDSKGPKWPALHDLIAANLELISKYAYVWLPDDDLQADTDGINLLFALCEERNLQIAQPSLTWDSYFGHLTTLQNRQYQIRFTNYVEVMAPCFSAKMLQRALHLFRSNLSGWGLDFIWSSLVDHPERDIAIIDAVAVRHTRPVGGPNYAALRAGGISPWDELRDFCKSHGIDEDPIIATHQAVRLDGTIAQADGRQRRFFLGFISGYFPALRYTPDRRRMIRRMAGMAYKVARNIPDRVSEQPMVKWKLSRARS